MKTYLKDNNNFVHLEIKEGIIELVDSFKINNF